MGCKSIDCIYRFRRCNSSVTNSETRRSTPLHGNPCPSYRTDVRMQAQRFREPLRVFQDVREELSELKRAQDAKLSHPHGWAACSRILMNGFRSASSVPLHFGKRRRT